jgi:hypothetical protein
MAGQSDGKATGEFVSMARFCGKPRIRTRKLPYGQASARFTSPARRALAST